MEKRREVRIYKIHGNYEGCRMEVKTKESVEENKKKDRKDETRPIEGISCPAGWDPLKQRSLMA